MSIHFEEIRDALLAIDSREELDGAYRVCRVAWKEGHINEAEWATLMNDHAGLEIVFPSEPITPLVRFS